MGSVASAQFRRSGQEGLVEVSVGDVQVTLRFDYLQTIENKLDIWRRGWDSNPQRLLIARNLLILLAVRTDQTAKTAALRTISVQFSFAFF